MTKQTEKETESLGVHVQEIIVEIPTYKVGEFQFEAQITEIELFEKAEMKFGDKTPENQIGKPIYEVTFTVLGDIPKGLSTTGNCIFTSNTAQSKKSKLYKYNSRYGNYPKVSDMVKVENNEKGFWSLIL